MDWILLVQDRAQWSAPVNTVLSRWVPSNECNFVGELLASPEGLCSMELVIVYLATMSFAQTIK
jgi:hypothetical protein